jgi:hypothetical protein
MISLTERLFSQYYRDPEATKKAFRGGHFGSGDLAVRNPDGSIMILDRIKDLIISGGEVSGHVSPVRKMFRSWVHLFSLLRHNRTHPRYQ